MKRPLSQGSSAKDVLKFLLEEEKDRERRQVGIVDAKGTIASFTGSKCNVWAGDLQGKNYTAQRIILNAFTLDPKLRSLALPDSDLNNLRGEKRFKRLLEKGR